MQLLQREGIRIYSRIAAIGGITDTAEWQPGAPNSDFPVADEVCGREMQACIREAAAQGDSVGGIVECVVEGIPAGLGDPIFGGMENRLAAVLFGIPAVKGVEFGAGFAAASLRGSENNDPFVVRDGYVETEGNHAGGILGGITDGMPLVFRVAFKPTPSISKTQKSVSLSKGVETYLQISGRHDPCVVPRALPAVEAAAALAVYDALLGRRRERGPWN